MCFCLSHYLTDSKQSYFSTSRVSFAYDDNCKSVAFVSYFSPALLGGGGGGEKTVSALGYQIRSTHCNINESGGSNHSLYYNLSSHIPQIRATFTNYLCFSTKRRAQLILGSPASTAQPVEVLTLRYHSSETNDRTELHEK